MDSAARHRQVRLGQRLAPAFPDGWTATEHQHLRTSAQPQLRGHSAVEIYQETNETTNEQREIVV